MHRFARKLGTFALDLMVCLSFHPSMLPGELWICLSRGSVLQPRVLLAALTDTEKVWQR